MAERSFNYDTAVGRVFRAAFLSLLPSPDNETREQPFITDRAAIGKSLYSLPPRYFPRDFLSLETPTRRRGEDRTTITYSKASTTG